jgi:hypothetical protein
MKMIEKKKKQKEKRQSRRRGNASFIGDQGPRRNKDTRLSSYSIIPVDLRALSECMYCHVRGMSGGCGCPVMYPCSKPELQGGLNCEQSCPEIATWHTPEPCSEYNQSPSSSSSRNHARICTGLQVYSCASAQRRTVHSTLDPKHGKV